jgi:hypothetical protein
MQGSRVTAKRTVQFSGIDQDIDSAAFGCSPHLSEQSLPEMIGRNQLSLPQISFGAAMEVAPIPCR